jgi:hypothetical protein
MGPVWERVTPYDYGARTYPCPVCTEPVNTDATHALVIEQGRDRVRQWPAHLGCAELRWPA